MRKRKVYAFAEAFAYMVIGAAFVLISLTLTLIHVEDSMPAPEPAPEIAAAEETADTETAAEAVATEYAYFIPPDLYTDADAEALAKMAWGECRGVPELTVDGRTISAKCQQAATMWCALNRYDAGFEDSIVDVVAAPEQFVGYDPEHPLDPELLALAYEVLDWWEYEKESGFGHGRVLPADYLFFTGDGVYNYFTQDWKADEHYAWTLPDFYAWRDEQ